MWLDPLRLGDLCCPLEGDDPLLWVGVMMLGVPAREPGLLEGAPPAAVRGGPLLLIAARSASAVLWFMTTVGEGLLENSPIE